MELTIIAGVAVGAVVVFAAGYLFRSQLGRTRALSSERRAVTILEDAGREAESLKRAAVLEGREEALRLKQQIEREMLQARNTQLAAERAFQEKEAAFGRRVELIEKMDRDLKRQETDLGQRERAVTARSDELERMLSEEKVRLERIANMSAEEARAQLISAIESEARAEAARRVTEIRDAAQRDGEREARKIIVLAMQRYAADHVSDHSVSVVHLPSDDMKGRIIGREGRNIRSFEIITGVDVIIDDTPEAVILSGFDPVRREVARLALERLVADGRIHPARIEEVVAKVKTEVESKIRELGEMACLEAGVHGIHPELQNLIGRLQYRTSYGQNILRHSVEVARLAGMMAAEIGMDEKTARRGGLLHDIGKAIDHDHEGSHPALGMEVAQRYGEPVPVLEAIGYHHDDYAGGSLWPVLISAADAISGARPGARRESLEIYIKRLEALEKIANGFAGVEKSYAIQAGREVRIMVEHRSVDDARAQGLAGEIARRIEKELEYPGQIRVTVIRETRAVDYANRSPMLRILFVADVIGSPGRKALRALLPGLRRQYDVDLAIVNAENSAGGFGLTPDAGADLLAAGADVLTGGNHLWDKKDSHEYLAGESRLVRPANMPEGTPGQGYAVFPARDGTPVGVVNLLGRVFMREIDSPFAAADRAVAALREKTRIVFVDFHAETTAEKMALGWHLDGRVSALVGTHTHVQTADERILPRGTAYLTDAGMTGGFDSVIGMERSAALRRFVSLMPERLSPADGDPRLNAVLVTVDPTSGRATAIERIQVAYRPGAATGTARLLSGDEPAQRVRDLAGLEVQRLRASGVEPCLALVAVGDHHASQVYLARKEKACAEAGILVKRVALAAGSDTRTVVERVRALGDDPGVHGILVQLPLAAPAEAQAVLESIPPDKDVDGFHPVNAGRLALGLPSLVPCTPAGILELLRHHEIPLAGAHVVVLGRSNIVGRPLATLLSTRGVDATVTLGHSASGPRLIELARAADVLVVAMGRVEAVTADWVKPGATVVDVGIHRVPDSTRRTGARLTGDVDAASVSQVAGALTPVPGGVGPMTVAMVVSNLVLAAARQTVGVEATR